jgi:hypothetical protein
MTETADVRIVTAGWSIPRAAASRFEWCVFDHTASGAAIENAWE